EIVFFTLRTTDERLRAQLDRRIARLEEMPDELSRHRLRKQRELRRHYDDRRFVLEWYERWRAFVAGHQRSTSRHFYVDVSDDYEVSDATRTLGATACELPSLLAAMPTI